MLIGALWTGLYELKMAAIYLRRGMAGPATFSLFVRHLPPERGYLVAAGLADCISCAVAGASMRWTICTLRTDPSKRCTGKPTHGRAQPWGAAGHGLR